MGEQPPDPQYPVDPRTEGYPPDPEDHPDPRWRVALAVAVAVVAIVLVLWYLTRGGDDAKQAAPSPSPSPTSTPTVTVTQTATPTPSDTAPQPCQGAALSPSIAPDGAAAGTVYLSLLLENTGSSPCTVSGRPVLSGVTAGGTTEELAVPETLDGSVGEKYPVADGGTVDPGAKAGILLSRINDPSNCPAGGSTYGTLTIDLGGGQVVAMPYPDELVPAACLKGQSAIGPVISP